MAFQIVAERLLNVQKQDISSQHANCSSQRISGNFTSVENIAALTIFLSSDAAQNLTGVPISNDGGWTAQ